MNKRSFRRGMEPPDLKEGWTRVSESAEQGGPMTLEEALRGLFDEILKQALAEMERQAEAGEGGRPINSWGIIKCENGQEFKLTLECMPPVIIPILN